ncbi:MAG: sugar ABC transporter substrate-binding protein [Spirochaetales bacterium]|nr:sugar ABC transporter substrate-binding protein [Spirochaetales bacterium]
MRKLLFTFILVTLMLYPVLANGEVEESSSSGGGMKVGLSLQDLDNQVWASRARALEKVVSERGGQLVYLGCGSDADKQLEQIETLVAGGIDILMVQPTDDQAVNGVLKSVKEKGVKVFVYDSDLENGDMRFLLKNYDAGYMIGTTAADWINRNLDGPVEVALINWPDLDILKEREEGIRDALARLSPQAKIVAASPALTPEEGQKVTAKMLREYPGIQVVCSIGGGGAVGANEAVKAAGLLSDDFGIFASDATAEEMAAMSRKEAIRSSIMYTGTPAQTAMVIYSWLEILYFDEAMMERVYHTFIPVNQDNYQDYM